MKLSILVPLLALLAIQVHAALTPAQANELRQFQAQITFIGAAGASFTQSVPTAPGSTFTISKSHRPASNPTMLEPDGK